MHSPKDWEHQAGGASRSTYDNASQLHTDAWNRLNHHAARLATTKADRHRLCQAVEDDFRLLEP
jgi:hypothetical protein